MLLFVQLLHIILCIILMLVILLQPGKGSDVGAAFGGGGGSSIFGPRGAGNFLSQATTIVAILFMFSSVFLAWSSSASARSGSDIEDAMKRLSRERIEGDVYQVPDGGLDAGAPPEPSPVPEVPAAMDFELDEGGDAPAVAPAEPAKPAEPAGQPATDAQQGNPAPIVAPTLPATE